MLDLSRKRVLVTGGSGFLGTHLLRALRARGSAPIAPTRREYDLVDGAAVRRLMRDARPEVVIHLAAVVGGIGANRASPGAFFYQNIMMGAQVMEEARLAGVEKLVAIGTVCSYPKHTPVPFREDDLWSGYPEETNAPYGLAKKMLLVQAQAYRAQYGLRSIFLIPVNLYGPGDSTDLERSHVIPALVRKLVMAERAGAPSVEVWGSGRASREFLYVEDAALAICLAMERYDGAEPVNIGTGTEIAIRDLVEKIRAMTGYRGEVVWDGARPDGQPRRSLDVSRAEARFGFRAETGLDEGLARTIAWARAEIDAGRIT